MINNPALKQPSCRFRREKVQQDNEDAFEVETPVHMLSEEILARTNRVAGRGDVISPVPIILRVEYCNCANLTIWDLPGKNDICSFIKQGLIRCEKDLDWEETVNCRRRSNCWQKK